MLPAVDEVALPSHFIGEVTDDELQHLVATLCADATWLVLDPFYHAPEWLFQIVHQPTGQPFVVHAARTATGWRFLADPEALARAALDGRHRMCVRSGSQCQNVMAVQTKPAIWP